MIGLRLFFCRFNNDGFRLLALAHKTNPSSVGKFSVEDEKDMVLLGYLAFLILQRNLLQKQSVLLKIMELKKRFLLATAKKLPVQSAVGLD